MAKRIAWDEQEALLLFDTYEKINNHPEIKRDLMNALSINLRRRAKDNGAEIDDVFRNNTGISMRISEIDKILHPERNGLVKTSELFRTTADLYINHRRTFLKRVQAVEEYRVKILPEMVGFDLKEAVILLDAYLDLDKPGETKAHTARLVSAKLRILAVNRGCIIKDAYRSESGIQGRLKKMGSAFSEGITNNSDVPQSFIDAVRLYRDNRAEYKRALRKANQLIGKVILPEDVARIEKEKQLAKDAAPVQKTKYIKTKKDRKLKETYPKAFVPVYSALETRYFTDPKGVTATDIFNDLKKKYPRKVIMDILQGASWAKELRTGKYVHVLGATFMSMQEQNEKKFFSWLKKKIPQAQYELITKNKSTICMILLQRKVVKKPFFMMDDGNEVSKLVNKIAPCFANVKLRSAAIQMVTMYATYLEEKALSLEAEEIIPGTSNEEDGAGIETVLQNELFTPLRDELLRQNIRTIAELQKMDLWAFMNRFNLYSIGTRHVVLSHTLALLDGKKDNEVAYALHIGNETYEGVTPASTFLRFCEHMATAYPLKFRTLVGVRIRNVDVIPLLKIKDSNCIKMANVNAYINEDLTPDNVIEYAKWLCVMCGKSINELTIDEIHPTPTEATVFTEDPVECGQDANIEPTLILQLQVDNSEDDPMVTKVEKTVLAADLDGMSYDKLSTELQISMSWTKELVGKSKRVVNVDGKLIHEDAFIDWEDGADGLGSIIDKLMHKNNGYISRAQLYEYVRAEMNMFLNDNDICDEREVFDIAKHLFEKNSFRGKQYSFRGNMHISRVTDQVCSNLDLFKKYASEQGGYFTFTGLVEYLKSVGVNTGNLRTQMRLLTESIFFYYDEDLLISAEVMNMDEEWEKSVASAVRALFDDVGDHIVLRDIPAIWYDRLPALPGAKKWTPLFLQSILRFYSEELGARTIHAMDGQAIETLHTMLVEISSPIMNFGDVVISHIIDHEIPRREFKAEDLRLELVNAGILQGNELIWNMPKALKGDPRFAWDATGAIVTINI
ncbi:MAG: hypothetical protein IKT52_12815 [Oscillospiraceae bacterium]|nr:hypothetical protein [Oscillospiraceae bacterium]